MSVRILGWESGGSGVGAGVGGSVGPHSAPARSRLARTCAVAATSAAAAVPAALGAVWAPLPRAVEQLLPPAPAAAGALQTQLQGEAAHRATTSRELPRRSLPALSECPAEWRSNEVRAQEYAFTESVGLSLAAVSQRLAEAGRDGRLSDDHRQLMEIVASVAGGPPVTRDRHAFETFARAFAPSAILGARALDARHGSQAEVSGDPVSGTAARPVTPTAAFTTLLSPTQSSSKGHSRRHGSQVNRLLKCFRHVIAGKTLLDKQSRVNGGARPMHFAVTAKTWSASLFGIPAPANTLAGTESSCAQ